MLWWVVRKKQDDCLHGERCVSVQLKEEEDKFITLKNQKKCNENPNYKRSLCRMIKSLLTFPKAL